jgi:hypothetical protein
VHDPTGDERGHQEAEDDCLLFGHGKISRRRTLEDSAPIHKTSANCEWRGGPNPKNSAICVICRAGSEGLG